jgi:hypothetical protein
MSKASELAAAVGSYNRGPKAPPAVLPAPETPAKKGWVAPSREGKKALISYHEPAVVKQLQQMKLDLDRESVQSLIEEALDDLFQKYRKPMIARKPA